MGTIHKIETKIGNDKIPGMIDQAILNGDAVAIKSNLKLLRADRLRLTPHSKKIKKPKGKLLKQIESQILKGTIALKKIQKSKSANKGAESVRKTG